LRHKPSRELRDRVGVEIDAGEGRPAWFVVRAERQRHRTARRRRTLCCRDERATDPRPLPRRIDYERMQLPHPRITRTNRHPADGRIIDDGHEDRTEPQALLNLFETVVDVLPVSGRHLTEADDQQLGTSASCLLIAGVESNDLHD
jgi:hypothetical protein